MSRFLHVWLRFCAHHMVWLALSAALLGWSLAPWLAINATVSAVGWRAIQRSARRRHQWTAYASAWHMVGFLHAIDASRGGLALDIVREARAAAREDLN